MIDFSGQELDNYRILRLLGSGGFGDVYLGEHMHSKQQVAVKVLSSLFRREDMINVQNEVRNQLRLNHSHIVKIIDFNLFNPPPFIVMEYAPNGTLRQRHAKGVRVPLPTVINYVNQIANALHYAHNQLPPLIHRDVKPENMLLNAKGEIMLADFGLATLMAHRPQSMRTQDIAGTNNYMSPEQSRGKPQIASDQYSLAVVVYEWLCGTLPFQADDPDDPYSVVIKHRTTPPPSLTEKMPTLPLKVEQVIITALDKEPEKRFRSISAFAQALQEASQPAHQHIEKPPFTPPTFLVPKEPPIIAMTPNESSSPQQAPPRFTASSFPPVQEERKPFQRELPPQKETHSQHLLSFAPEVSSQNPPQPQPIKVATSNPSQVQNPTPSLPRRKEAAENAATKRPTGGASARRRSTSVRASEAAANTPTKPSATSPHTSAGASIGGLILLFRVAVNIASSILLGNVTHSQWVLWGSIVVGLGIYGGGCSKTTSSGLKVLLALVLSVFVGFAIWYAIPIYHIHWISQIMGTIVGSILIFFIDLVFFQYSILDRLDE